MGMKTSSAKNKGRTLQKYIVSQILSAFPSLTTRDVQSTSMGASGVDVKLSEAAIKLFPFAIEAKNQEKVSVWASFAQAESNTTPDTKPLLVIKRNRQDPLVVLKFTDFMDIMKG